MKLVDMVVCQDCVRSMTVTHYKYKHNKVCRHKPVVKPVEQAKPIDKPVDNPVEQPVDKPVDEPIDKPVDKPIDKPIEQVKQIEQAKPKPKPKLKPIAESNVVAFNPIRERLLRRKIQAEERITR